MFSSFQIELILTISNKLGFTLKNNTKIRDPRDHLNDDLMLVNNKK